MENSSRESLHPVFFSGTFSQLSTWLPIFRGGNGTRSDVQLVFVDGYDAHECDPPQHSQVFHDKHLERALPPVLLQLGQHVNKRNVEKDASGDGEYPVPCGRLFAQKKPGVQTSEGCQCRQEVEEQSSTVTQSGRDQHHKVTEFMGKLVAEHGQRCGEATFEAGRKSSADGQTISHVVDGATNDYHGSQRRHATAK